METAHVTGVASTNDREPRVCADSAKRDNQIVDALFWHEATDTDDAVRTMRRERLVDQCSRIAERTNAVPHEMSRATIDIAVILLQLGRNDNHFVGVAYR